MFACTLLHYSYSYDSDGREFRSSSRRKKRLEPLTTTDDDAHVEAHAAKRSKSDEGLAKPSPRRASEEAAAAAATTPSPPDETAQPLGSCLPLNSSQIPVPNVQKVLGMRGGKKTLPPSKIPVFTPNKKVCNHSDQAAFEQFRRRMESLTLFIVV